MQIKSVYRDILSNEPFVHVAVDGEVSLYYKDELSELPVQSQNKLSLRAIARELLIPSKVYLYAAKESLIEMILDGSKVDQPRVEKVPAVDVTVETEVPKTDDLADVLAKALKGRISTEASIDEAKVEEIVDNAMSKHVNSILDKLSQVTKNVKITMPDKKEIDVKNAHYMLPEILQEVQDGRNVWMFGEAGSFKTSLAGQIAELLELPFYSQSVTSQTTKSDLLGYMNVNGDYVPSLFYNAYVNGGIFLLDEVDNGNANVINVLNAATSNGHAAFPNGMQAKHKSFRIIAAANTIGQGASRAYIGRNPIDEATRSRYVFLQVNTDWKLVDNIVTQSYGEKGHEWFRVCFDIKKILDEKGITSIMVTSRTVFDGVDNWCRGQAREKILDKVLFKGCEQSVKDKVLK